MKRLLLILILTLSFQTLTKGDDIREFEIEGMAIGDSLLDYLSESDIIAKTAKNTSYKNKRYSYLMLDSYFEDYNFTTYEAVYVHYQSKDNKYKIQGISGILDFKSKINECYEKMRDIDLELSALFKSLEISKGSKFKHTGDKKGNTTIKENSYKSSDEWSVTLQCYDWSEESGHNDHLRITIRNKDYSYFLKNEAY